jgi:hypothetical protein
LLTASGVRTTVLTLSAGVDCNAEDAIFGTPLVAAARGGHEGVVAALLDDNPRLEVGLADTYMGLGCRSLPAGWRSIGYIYHTGAVAA